MDAIDSENAGQEGPAIMIYFPLELVLLSIWLLMCVIASSGPQEGSKLP